MAWIYLAESAESHSPSSRGSKRSPTASETRTRKVFSSPEWQMARWTEPLSGTTSQLSKARIFRQSTSSSAASRARTSRLRELVQAWQASALDYSSRSCAWPKKSSPHSYSLKTSRPSAPAASTLSSKLWPSSGMTLDGRLFPLNPLERITGEIYGSCLLPTPTASTAGTNGKKKCPKTGKWVNGKPSLAMMAARNLWPTPTVRDSNTIAKVTRGANAMRGGTPLPVAVGGTLNPQFVEWMMGFPLEWTVCAAWAMPSSRSKRGARSKSSQGSVEAA